METRQLFGMNTDSSAPFSYFSWMSLISSSSVVLSESFFTFLAIEEI